MTFFGGHSRGCVDSGDASLFQHFGCCDLTALTGPAYSTEPELALAFRLSSRAEDAALPAAEGRAPSGAGDFSALSATARAVDIGHQFHVAKPLFAGRIRLFVVEDALGEVVGLRGELVGVFAGTLVFDRRLSAGSALSVLARVVEGGLAMQVPLDPYTRK